MKHNKDIGLHKMIIVSMAGLSVLILLMFIFFKIGAIITANSIITEFDYRTLKLITGYRRPGLSLLLRAITYMGNAGFYFVLMPILIIIYVYNKRIMDISALTIALLGSHLINEYLKGYYARIRPVEFFLFTQEGFSFPSGHAMISMSFYGMLAYILCRRVSDYRSKSMIIISFSMLILLIGFSRLYFGVHWPSDVIGGYIAGLVWLIFCIIGLEWAGQNDKSRHS